MCEIWNTMFGITCGAIGYLLVTFVFQPILRYRDVKLQVFSDLIFFANVINADGLNEEMTKRSWARVEANRRHAADLKAANQYLPSAYRWYLNWRHERPDEAAAIMMELSNTSERTAAREQMKMLRAELKFAPEK